MLRVLRYHVLQVYWLRLLLDQCVPVLFVRALRRLDVPLGCMVRLLRLVMWLVPLSAPVRRTLHPSVGHCLLSILIVISGFAHGAHRGLIISDRLRAVLLLKTDFLVAIIQQIVVQRCLLIAQLG